MPLSLPSRALYRPGSTPGRDRVGVSGGLPAGAPAGERGASGLASHDEADGGERPGSKPTSPSPPARAGHPGEEATGSAHGGARRPRLLLVGPLASLHRRLAAIYAVRTVPTVRAAEAALGTHAPHLVMSAAELPDGDGLAVVAAADRRSPEDRPAVIMLSPTDREPFPEAAAVALAAVARFQSPIDPSADAFGLRVVSAAYGRLGDAAFGPAELATAVGLSPRQLRRRLIDLAGEAPGDLLRRLRLERAAELLAAAARVDEAGHAAGFGGASTFRAAFRRHVGVAPSAYARAAQPTPPPPMSETERFPSETERFSTDDAPADPPA